MQVRSFADCCSKAQLDPLGFLRRSTHRLHSALEHDTPLARLAEHDCTVADYRLALRPLVSIYCTLDRQLIVAEQWKPTVVGVYRARSPLLLAELHRWGGAHRPIVDSPQVLDSAAAYLGVRYVIDGAQFGHRVIAASLARSPAAVVVAQEPGFWSTPFVSAAEWRRLRCALESLGTRSELATAARAARRTFELFSRQLHAPALEVAL